VVRIHIFAKDIEKTETKTLWLPMQDDFKILIGKLNAFIRKYYKSLLIKGLLLSFTAVLLLYLFFDFIEYFAWMGKTGRQILFFSFLLFTFIVFIYWVVVPLLKLFRIGKTITYEEAAKIVGKFFPEVEDKLVNVLQLKNKEKEVSKEEIELLLASVSQKTIELKPVPFTKAVDFKKNFKYVKYFIPVFLIALAILLIYPSFITEPSGRIVHFTDHFEKPLPFKVNIINDSLTVVQHEDFMLQVEITGEEIPNDVYVQSTGFNYKLYQVQPGLYEYTFKNVNTDFVFRITTEEYQSKEYQLKVYPKPLIYSFDVVLNYPSYLKKKQDVISGLGDLTVPEGTVIQWRIHTKDASEVTFLMDDSSLLATLINENTYTLKTTALQSFRYSLLASNNFVTGQDTLSYSVQTIADEYPKISVEEYTSKNFMGYVQLTGSISDDYGFHSLRVLYKNEKDEAWSVKKLTIDKGSPEQYFRYDFQLLNMGLKPGDGFNYYFEVRDNDALHGYKTTRSVTGYVKLPDPNEIGKAADSTSDMVKQSMQKRIKELEELNKQADEFKLDLLDKKDLNWADKQKLSELLNREKEVQKQLDELQKLNEEIKNLEEAIKKKADPELMKRLEELQKMFEELNDKELQKELEKMKKDLDKMDKDKLSKFLDEMKKKNETLKDNLEQNLELFKQMEIEKKVNETAEKLSALAEKQENLSEKTKNKANNKEQLAKEQEEIKKELKEIEKEIDEISDLDKELEEPFKIEKDSASMKDIKNDIKNGQEQLQKNKRKKSSDNQKDAASKMKKMSKTMLQMMMEAMQQRAGEDMEMVRRLLDNLLDLSFQQEGLIKEIGSLSTKDPKFVTSTEQLRSVKDGFKIIHDSLSAIGKRQVFIQPFIIRETESVETNIANAISQMQERQKGKSLSQQQYAMTHMNNLALMLEEALNKMKQNMNSSSSKGGKSCPNPGKGNKPSLNKLMQMQEGLSSGLKKGKKGEGKKNKNGKKTPGDEDGDSSSELAKMAAIQYEIRQRLQEYIEELKSNGGNGNALNDVLKEMEKTEDDIINRRINQETIERQKKIKVRLLKAQNAEMQREKEKRRESEEGKNSRNRNLNSDLKYKKSEFGQEGIIQMKPIELNFYLKSVFKKYLYKIELENDKTK